MPMVPAFCDCSAIVPSGIFVENATNTTFSGNQVRCPFCNGWARVPDGVFDFIADAIRVIAAPQRTLDDLRRLLDLIRSSAPGGAPREVADRIEKEAPGFAGLARLLRDPRVQVAALALLLKLLSMMIDQAGKSPAPSVEIRVEQHINLLFDGTPIPPLPLPGRRM